MLVVQKTIVHHFKWNSRFHHGLVKPKCRIFYLGVRILTSVANSGLLRIDHSHRSERMLIAQAFLVDVVPPIEFFDYRQPTLIDRLGVELGKPGSQAFCNAVDHPKPDLVSVLHGVLPAILFFETDAENTGDRFAAHGGPVFLSVFAVRPWRNDPAARLPVGKQRRRKLPNNGHIQFAQSPAAGIRDVTRIRIDSFDMGVPKTPKLKEPLLVPDNVFTTRGILRIFGSRDIEMSEVAEVLLAVLAVTHS